MCMHRWTHPCVSPCVTKLSAVTAIAPIVRFIRAWPKSTPATCCGRPWWSSTARPRPRPPSPRGGWSGTTSKSAHGAWTVVPLFSRDVPDCILVTTAGLVFFFRCKRLVSWVEMPSAIHRIFLHDFFCALIQFSGKCAFFLFNFWLFFCVFFSFWKTFCNLVCNALHFFFQIAN